jgi:mannan endo-1,4-beta-mannosidase
MMTKKKQLYRMIGLAGLSVLLCLSTTAINFAQSLVDGKASHETKALYQYLRTVSEKGLLFGHHEGLAYGINWQNEPGRSDVKDVCGSFPAVHGWDVGKEGDERNIDGVLFGDMQKWIREVYERGGINTVSWHADNPVSQGHAWDTTRAVKHILPGGKYHQEFLTRLARVADFLESCKSADTYIPIIFRPFHEHNGDWFWWGKGPCTEKEFIALWRFTVDYLKNTRELHHLLYAFSPDRSRFNEKDIKASYLYGYPGDDYVDIIGYDNYMDVGIEWNTRSPQQQSADLVNGLKVVSAIANEKNKVAAITETGLEGITHNNWFTKVILSPIKSNPEIKMAYIMVWRNANTKHHYAPYPGHDSVPDFIRFYQDNFTLFEHDLIDVYRKN